MQSMRQTPDTIRNPAGMFLHFSHSMSNDVRPRRKLELDVAQGYRESGDLLIQVIMQLSRNVPPLFLLRLHQTRCQLPDLCVTPLQLLLAFSECLLRALLFGDIPTDPLEFDVSAATAKCAVKPLSPAGASVRLNSLVFVWTGVLPF